MKYDVTIIGSGIAGLTAGLLLALNNKKVAIFEKSKKIAPLLSRFKRNNIWCDPGFHYAGGLQDKGKLSIIFNYMGIKYESRPLNPECFDTIFINNKEYNLPYGLKRLKSYLSSEFPKSRNAVKEFIKNLNKNITEYPFTRFDNNLILTSSSLSDFLKNAGAEEGLIQLLGTHAYYLSGAEADEIPLYLYTHIMAPLYSNASTLKKGGDSLIDAFKSRLKELDVSIFTDSEITEIISDDSKTIKSIKTKNNEIIECDHCISTIHPGLLVNILPKSFLRPVFLNRIKNYENTVSPLVVFFDIEEIPDLISNSNYFINSKQVSDTKLGFISPGNTLHKKSSFAAINYCFNELTEFFFKNEYKDIKDAETEKLINCFYSTFPELKGKLTILDTATPKTYQDYTGTIAGSMYGVKQSVNQYSVGSKGGIKGLYLSGQSITPGIMGSVYSSLIAVLKIVEPAVLLNSLRKYC